MKKTKKYLLLSLILTAAHLTTYANSNEETAVREYLITTTQIVQKHIAMLDAAENSTQAAGALKKYAAAMQPVMKKSSALKKKYPKAFSGDALKTDMEAMFKTMTTMNEKIGQAKQKYGQDKKFQEGEKALKRAGLFGAKA